MPVNPTNIYKFGDDGITISTVLGKRTLEGSAMQEFIKKYNINRESLPTFKGRSAGSTIKDVGKLNEFLAEEASQSTRDAEYELYRLEVEKQNRLIAQNPPSGTGVQTEAERKFKEAKAGGMTSEEALRSLVSPDVQIAGVEQTPQLGVPRYGETLTLPNGQRIAFGDDNYDIYAKQLDIQIPENGIPEKTNFEKLDIDMSNLTESEKGLVESVYNIMTTEDKAAQQDMIEAFNRATKLVDPYYRQNLSIAKDAISRSVSGVERSANQNIEDLQRKIVEINEDLQFNRDQLSIEQQAELSRQSKKYQAELSNAENQLAMRGLAYSSIREKTAQNMGEEFQDVTESTQRLYTRQLRGLESGSARDIGTAQRGISRVGEEKISSLTGISREGEGVVGSDELPSIGGVKPLGGIAGSLTQERLRDIYNIGTTVKEGGLLKFS